VPAVSSPAKTARIGQLADLVITGDRYADALEAAQQWIAAPGAMGVHACGQRETIPGQAAPALELDGQAGPLDTVLVPVGGGLVFPITQAWVQDVALADDDAIRAAQHTLWHAARTAAVPAAGAGVAALLTGAYKPAPGEDAAVIITGADLTPSPLDS
jgi:threonine dehydratase